jgi:hypothetical protein
VIAKIHIIIKVNRYSLIVTVCQQQQTHQGHHRQATAAGALAKVGVLATKGSNKQQDSKDITYEQSRDSSNIRGLSNTRNARNSRIPGTHGEITAVESLATAGVEAFEGTSASADIPGASQTGSTRNTRRTNSSRNASDIRGWKHSKERQQQQLYPGTSQTGNSSNDADYSRCCWPNRRDSSNRRTKNNTAVLYTSTRQISCVERDGLKRVL